MEMKGLDTIEFSYVTISQAINCGFMKVSLESKLKINFQYIKFINTVSISELDNIKILATG
jgi:hypothetical protein